MKISESNLNSTNSILAYLEEEEMNIKNVKDLDTSANRIILDSLTSIRRMFRDDTISFFCKDEDRIRIEQKTGQKAIENGASDTTRPFRFDFYEIEDVYKAIEALKFNPQNYTEGTKEKIINNIYIDISNVMEMGEDFLEERYHIKFDQQMLDYWSVVAAFLLYRMETDSSLETIDDLMQLEVLGGTFVTIEFEDVLYYMEECEKVGVHFIQLRGKYIAEDLATFVMDYPKKADLDFENIDLLVDRLLELNDDEDYLEINLEKYNHIINNKKKHPNNKFTVLEVNYITIASAYMKLESLGYDNCYYYDRLDELKYQDKIFINSNITRNSNSRDSYEIDYYWEELPEIRSFLWDSCMAGIYRLKDTGKAVGIIYAGELSSKHHYDIRKFVVENGYVEAVIKLPEKSMKSTWLNPYLLVFKKNSSFIKMIDASKEVLTNRVRKQQGNEYSEELIDWIIETYQSNKTEVSIEDLMENEYNLLPERYKQKEIEGSTISLGDVLEDIGRGCSLPATVMNKNIVAQKTDMPCLISSCIGTGIVSNVVYWNSGNSKKFKNNTAKRGDLIVGKGGNPFKCAVSNDDYLVIGNLYILRFDQNKLKMLGISQEYICCFLTSKAGQEEIRKYLAGALSPIISISNIRNLQIPIYSESNRQKMVHKTETMLEEMKEYYKRLEIIQEEIGKLFD